MDPRVQDLQGKAERVTPSDLLRHLVDAFGEKAALRRRHEAVARVAGQYDLNNTYQYVIAREDQHLGWLASAILDLGGGTVSGDAPPLDAPAVKGDAAVRGVVLEDAQALDAFVNAWRPRVAGITHARHRRMIERDARRDAGAGPALPSGRGGQRGPPRPSHGRRPHARRRAAHALGGVVPLAGIALGSNLGDRRAHLDSAVASLGAILADLHVSRVFETDPVGVVGPQGPFLNAAVAGEFEGARTRTAGHAPDPRTRARPRAPARGRGAHAGPRPHLLRRRACGRAGAGRSASAVPRAAIRARAAGRGGAGLARSGDRAHRARNCWRASRSHALNPRLAVAGWAKAVSPYKRKGRCGHRP